MLLESEIAEEYQVTGKQILTPNGWKDIKTIYKTIPLPVIVVKTKNHRLECSDHHMIKTTNGWKQACDLTNMDDVITESGEETIMFCYHNGKVEALYDITIDDPSGEFYSDGIVSHNSTTFAARQLILSHLLPNYKSLYVCPQADQLKTYVRRFAEMEAAFRFDNGKQNLYNKVYSDGSAIDMNYCLTSANAVRGKSVTEVLVDECVSFDTTLFRNGNNFPIDVPVKICDICIGDQVRAFDRNKNIVYGTVTDKKYKGCRPCWRIKTSTGHELKATSNHRVYTSRGWMVVSDIRDGFYGTREARLREAVAGSVCVLNESEGTSDATWNSTWGWMHSEWPGILLRPQICLSSQYSSERLCCSQSSSVSSSVSEYEYRGKQRLRGVVCSHNNNKMRPSINLLLGLMLQQAGSSVGRNCEDVQIRYRAVGKSVDMGGYRLVDTGRRKHKQQYIQPAHGIILRPGDHSTDGLVSQEWHQERWCSYGDSEEVSTWNGVSHYNVYHSSFPDDSEEYLSVHAQVDDVQSSDRQGVRGDDLQSVREYVYDDSEQSFFDASSRKCILRKLQGYCSRRNEAQVYREKGHRRNACYLARGEEEDCRSRQREEEGLLQGEQGEHRSESKSEAPRRSCGRGNLGERGDLCLLWEAVQDEPEDTQISIESWYIRMLSQGVQKETRKLPRCSIQIAEEGKDGKIIFSDISSVEFCGYTDVWDITTSPHNTYIADGICVHNCQGMDPDIIPEMLYVQTTAQYPSTIYAGTALSIDTLLESKWQASSMGMWHVRNGDDSDWLNMYDMQTLHDVCDNPQGPTCPKTGKLLEVTKGCYVHANRKALAVNDIGIHVPQCIIPDLAYNPIQWGKIYKKIQTDDFKKVMQECFGIAVAEGSREITEADLQRMCVLQDDVEQLKEKCRNGYYRLIVSGCDWGGSDYNQAIKTKTSYTVHCIIGVAPDDTVDILYYRRFSGMDYREIAEIIANTHYAFHGNVIASDFGVGLAYNTEIRNRIPFDRHFIMNYVGPAAAPLATPGGQHMANQLALNRTEAITNVFQDLKAPHLKIRARNWGDMSPYLLDWLNMYRVPVELPSGQNTFKYIRSATKADDALHAFTFAYVLVKFYLGEPLVKDVALENLLRNTLHTQAPDTSTELDRLLMGGEPDYCISG